MELGQKPLLELAREAKGCEKHPTEKALKFAATCDGCLQSVVVSQME